nr:hypothetical protein 12 [Piscirickettsiaceae bacterium]
MSRKYKLSERQAQQTVENKGEIVRTNQFKKHPHGLYFFNEHERADLTNFEILHTGIDTLEQKYNGVMNQQLMEQWLFNVVQTELGKRLIPIDYPKKTVVLNKIKMRLSRAPAKSGYRYQLQNNSYGIIIFFGHFHNKEWLTEGSIKIRLSPQFIYREGVEKSAYICDEFADLLLHERVYNGVSSHMCMDVQGWQPEVDFLHNVKTRTRVKRALPSAGSIDGHVNLSSPQLDHENIAVRYDREMSFLLGKSNSGQMAIYSKLEEAKKSNKFEFWETVYRQNLQYDETKDVFRIEGRLPASVLSKLGEPEKGGTGECYNIQSIHDLIPHIPALWRYCLYDLFRYQYPDSNVVRPEWQFLAEAPFMDLQDSEYKYQRVKVTQTGSDSDRNISQLLGHLAAYCAKEDVSNEQIEQLIYNFPQRNVINKYFRNKGLNQEQWIAEFIEKVEDKRLDLAPVYESPFKNVKGYNPPNNDPDKVPF